MTTFNEEFYLLIAFLLFWFFAFKPMRIATLSFLDTKIALIARKILEAKNRLTQSEQLCEQHQGELNAIKQERDEAMADAKMQLNKILDEKAQDLEANMDFRRNELEEQYKLDVSLAANDIHYKFVGDANLLAKKYLLDNRQQMPSDIEIARKLLKNF